MTPLYQLLVANLNRRVVVPGPKGPVRGKLWRVGRIGSVITVDLLRKGKVKSIRIA